MTLLIVTIGLIILTIIVLTGFAIHKQKKLYLRLAPLSFLWLLILLFGSFTKINANEVGIIYHDQKGILDEVKTEGFKSKSIFEHITKISTTNKNAYLEVNAQTSDSIYAVFEITITYKIEANNAGKFYKVTGQKDIVTNQLNSTIKESLQSITTTYDIFQIMGQELDTVRSKVFETLKEHLLQRYYVTLISLSIDDVDAGDRVEQIIQEKAEAIQKNEIAEREKQRAEIEAQTALIKAQNEAEIKKLQASADAEAQEILNSVTVNAIKEMYNSQFKTEDERTNFEENNKGGFLTIQEISEIVIKQLYYDTWDGKLPEVITDSDGSIIIQP